MLLNMFLASFYIYTNSLNVLCADYFRGRMICEDYDDEEDDSGQVICADSDDEHEDDNEYEYDVDEDDDER